MIRLNARGTMIGCKKEIIKKSDLLNAYYERWNQNDTPYFLDYDTKTVNKLIDYLKGYKIANLDKIRHIADELLITLDEGIIVLTGEKITQYQQQLGSKYFEFVAVMKNTYNVKIDVFSSSVMLSMMSYYLGFQLREATDLTCMYRNFLNDAEVTGSINTLKQHADILESKIISKTETEHIIDISKSSPYLLTCEYYVFEKNINYFEIYSVMDLFRTIVKIRETKLDNGHSIIKNISTRDIDIYNDADDVAGTIDKLKTLVDCTIVAKKQGEIKDNNYKVIHGEFKYLKKDYLGKDELATLFKCPFILTCNKYTKLNI